MTHDIIIPEGTERHLVLHCLSEDVAEWHICQQAHSKLTVHIFDIDGKTDTDNAQSAVANQAGIELIIIQQGEGAETYIYGMGLLSGCSQRRYHTRVVHQVGCGKSEQLLKFALRDNAQAEYFGEVVVAPDAQRTEARQTNRNILLSPTATIRTLPQLEIYADDVQCSHGATTGQLDETALFYMQQRGLSPETARQLLLAAFFYDILNTINSEELVKKLERKIENVVNSTQQN